MKTISLILILILIAEVLIAARLCYRPPSLEGRTVSQAVAASLGTMLGAIVLNLPPEQTGDSGGLAPD